MTINVNKSGDPTKFGFGLDNDIPYCKNERLCKFHQNTSQKNVQNSLKKWK